MLPKTLSSSYEQYKADSDFVANWLATTARAHGYTAIETTSTDVRKAPRLKGKARRLAREASQSSAPVHGDKQRSYSVKIKDFIPLAEFIAARSTPRIEAPSAFSYRLRQAITQRRFHQRWHRGQADGSASSEDGHSHFIGILEQVQAILRSNFVEKGKSEVAGSGNEVPDRLKNMFDGLVVEETVGVLVEDTAPKASTVADSIEFTSELSAGKGEASIAMMYVFVDAHNIRKLLRNLWNAYSNGELDLAAVAIATNTAIDFIRNLQEDFEATFDPADGNELNGHPCLYCLYQLDPDVQDPSRADYPHDICTMFTSQILSCYVRDFETDPSDFMPLVPPTRTSLWEREDWASMTRKEELLRHFNIAAGVIPEYFAVTMRNASIQAEHELIRGLRELRQRKESTLWLSFALQIYLDIRHILGENITCAFSDLCAGAEAITKDIEQVLNFHDTAKVKDHPSTDHTLREVLDLVDRWTRNDIVHDRRKDLLLDESSSNHLESFYLLKRDPLWCGLLLYNFRMVTYEGAIITANSWMSVLAGAHLFNALRQRNMVTSCWMDMDFVLSTQGWNRLFVGDLPKTLVDCSKRYLLASGLSPTAWARNRRRSRINMSTDKARKLEKQIPVSWIFKHRYCDNSGRRDFTPQDVQQILRKRKKSTEETATRAIGKVQICDLLSSLTLSLHTEALEATFDYFQLHMNCWTLLRDLKDKLGSQNEAWSSYPHGEEHLPSLVFFLLDEAEASLPSCRVLEDAGHILEEFLATRGAQATKKRDMLLVASKMKRHMLVSKT